MSEEVHIITNNVPRFTIDPWELTPKERDEFPYIDWQGIEEGRDRASFVRYKGELYDLGDSEGPAMGWDAIYRDSFFSGVLVRYVRGEDSTGVPVEIDTERVICARYWT